MMNSPIAAVSRRRVARSFALGTLAAAALVASGLSAGTARADTPPGALRAIVAQGQTSITTDKPAYVVGDPITISYTLPGPGQIRITDHQGSQVSTLRSGYSSQADGTIQGTITPPVGQECLKLEYAPHRTLTEMPSVHRLVETGSGQSGQIGLSSAETCFQVTDKAAPMEKSTPKELPQGQGQGQGQGQTPAPAPGLGLHTLRSKVTDQLLDSNTAGKVYPLMRNGGQFQKWNLEAGPDGYVFIRNFATGLYLDSNPNGDVYALAKNGGAFQQWKVEPAADGYVTLRNRQTGRYLVDSRGLVNTGELKAGEQLGPQTGWKLEPAQPL
jgi:hypothetical protein